MPDVDHVFLTRFNLPSEGNERAVRLQERWLEQRVALFERYCLPSVLAQTARNFQWIIYFDPQSPDWLHQRIRTWENTRVLRAFFRPSVSHEEMGSDVRAIVPCPRSRLLTTNLDNDDGLAANFVERLQAESFETPRSAIYFANGLIRSKDQVFLRRDPENAFCSVSESWDAPLFCWAAYHNSLSWLMPTRIISGAPAWLQVVHTMNVSNRIHGRLVSPSTYRKTFPRLLDDVPKPSWALRARDVACARPARFLQEASRLAIKAIVFRVAGNRGLDRVKSIWTLRRTWRASLAKTKSLRAED
jgi:hypothetical protein